MDDDEKIKKGEEDVEDEPTDSDDESTQDEPKESELSDLEDMDDPKEKPDEPEEEEPEPVIARPSQFRRVGSSMDDNFGSQSSQISGGLYGNNRKSGASKIVLIILALIIIGLIGVGAYLLRGKLTGGGSSEPSPSPTIEETQSSPSPSPALDRSKFTIRVLNGTSKAGLAASEAAKLKDLGYKIDKTGNASNSAFARTVIKVKTSATGLLDLLIKDLAPDFDATTASDSAVLKDSDAADGEVTLGTK